MNDQTGTRVSRRTFLATSAAASAIVISGRAIIQPTEAWGYEVKALQPETMRSLVRMARDIYPHDRLDDRYYILAVKVHDEKAASDAELKGLIEDGMAKLNTLARSKNGVDYADVADEGARTAVLRDVAKDPFFQKVRSGLITGLYNNKEVWLVFGYEGESASKGGYINRGFNDLDWL
jgi:hypothetical protein